MNWQRTFVLGLDGVPYTLLLSMFSRSRMKNLKRICEAGALKRINSVMPVISSVAWTTYATGKDPGQHNIYGFVDRNINPFHITIPISTHRKAETIWSRLSGRGKRVVAINVPMTYPPEPVNGIVVSCFLCTDIEKSTYPEEFYKYLQEREYVIDVDAWLVRESRQRFLEELVKVLKKRFEVAFELMERENWDFFQLHVMETDRLMHFFWDAISGENGTGYSEPVNNFFEMLDGFIGELYKRLDKNDRLIILSDHGFCAIKSEVQLNNWLEAQGLLMFNNADKRQLMDYKKESVCYSLLPGRIYINLEGREEKGSVPIRRYKEAVEEVKERLTRLRDPDNGQPVIQKVFLRDEIYSGEYIGNAPDIIAHPHDGYDLKGSLDTKNIFTNSILNGMHTYHDATLIGVNCDISQISSIQQVADIILNT